MFWKIFKKKPVPKPAQEKKDQEPQPMRIDDFCKYREGYFTKAEIEKLPERHEARTNPDLINYPWA